MSDTGSNGTVKLQPVLDLTAAAPLRDELLAHRGNPIALDASEVDRLGGLCLQVLMSAQATWVADEVEFSFAGMSPAFQEGIATFGAAPHFPCLDGVDA